MGKRKRYGAISALFLFFIMLLPHNLYAAGRPETEVDNTGQPQGIAPTSTGHPETEVDTVLLKVLLNTEDRGEQYILLSRTGDVLVSEAVWKEIGFKEISSLSEIAGERYISLKSLSPQITFSIDQNSSSIMITAEPSLLRRQTVDLSKKELQDVIRLRQDSGFLNYYLDYGGEDTGDRFQFASFNASGEIGVRIDRLLGYSNFSYTKTDSTETFVRLMSNITMDDEAKLRRYVIGDFTAGSGGDLGSSGNFGGISISKNYSLSPYFIKTPQLELKGLLQTPSEVEVYVNDILIQRQKFSAGEFDFLNLPNTSGAGETTIIIRDAYGRERKITAPFYMSSRLLRPGVDEYSYNLGFKREAFGTENFQYNDLALFGFHRIGLFDKLTAGVRGEADKDVVNIGPTAAFIIGNIAEADTSAAASENSGKFGYAAAVNLSVPSKYGINTRLSARAYSREYADISSKESTDRTRFYGLAGLGVSLKSIGSLSANYSVTDKYAGTDTKQVSLYYSTQLLRNISFYASAARKYETTTNDEVFAGINIFLDGNVTAGMNQRTQTDQTVYTAEVQKNLPQGIGSGYRFHVERDDNEDMSGQGQLQYSGQYGVYGFDYRRSGEENNYNLKTSGGLAFINSSLYPTRPINDSFVLVKAGDTSGVKVNYNNQEAGVTNGKGEALVPGLISYYENKLAIDAEALPINYVAAETSKFVALPYRSGGVVQFDIVKLRTFDGKVYFVKGTEKTPAEYAGLEIKMDRQESAVFGYSKPDDKLKEDAGDKVKVIEAVVGKDGRFYLENIPPGKFYAHLFSENKECYFDLIIPEGAESSVDLGEIECRMESMSF